MKYRSKPYCFLIFLTAVVIGLFSACEFCLAADLPGSKDHPLLKRFGGSEIVGYDVKRFDEFELQTSTFKRHNLQTKRREYAQAPLKLEGGITRIWYEAAGDASSAELAGNYRNELTGAGFRILYDSSKDQAIGSWSGFLNLFGDMKIKTSRSNYVFLAADQQKIRVLSAVKERPQGDVYVSLTAIEWARDDSTYKARKGAYAAVRHHRGAPHAAEHGGGQGRRDGKSSQPQGKGSPLWDIFRHRQG